MTYKQLLENLFSSDSTYKFILEETSSEIRAELMNGEKFILKMNLRITDEMNAEECYRYFLEKVVIAGIHSLEKIN